MYMYVYVYVLIHEAGHADGRPDAGVVPDADAMPGRHAARGYVVYSELAMTGDLISVLR